MRGILSRVFVRIQQVSHIAVGYLLSKPGEEASTQRPRKIEIFIDLEISLTVINLA